MKKSKVIVFINCGKVVSGAEIVFGQYLKTIKDFNFYLITSNAKVTKQFFKGINNNCIRNYYSKYFPVKLKFFQRLVNFALLIAETLFIWKTLTLISLNHEISLVYANNTVASVCISMISFINGSKYNTVAHIHDMMSESSFSPFIKLFGASINKYVSVSKSCKRELVNITNIEEKKITVIYNGINLKNLETTVVNNVKNNYFSIGFAGSIIYRKGLHILGDAFIILSKKYPNMKLFICSNYKDKDYFLTITNKFSDYKNVELLSLKRESMRDFYKSMDILVVPSLKDPLPTVVLEAMSLGKIVIGSNIDGITEMLDKEYLFDSNNSSAVAKKIEAIMKDYPNIEKICIRNNIEKIRNKFSSEITNYNIQKIVKNYIS